VNTIRMSKLPDELGVSKNTARRIAKEADAIISYSSRCKWADMDKIDEYLHREGQKNQTEEVSD